MGRVGWRRAGSGRDRWGRAPLPPRHAAPPARFGGGTLGALLRSHDAAHERVAGGVMRQVVDGIAHLHAHKIYHRDRGAELRHWNPAER
eukprot:gene16068-4558_t